jgi:hypothetical protein
VARLLLALVAAAAVVACDGSGPETSAPIGARAEANGFVLETRLPKATWGPDEAIQVSTTFTWIGAAPMQSVWASAGGPVLFGLQQLDGPVTIGPASDLVCAKADFQRGVVTPVPFAKSGGWSGDDPNAAFYQRFFADPQLHLPRGRWRLRVTTEGFLAPCDAGARNLNLNLPPIDFEVR